MRTAQSQDIPVSGGGRVSAATWQAIENFKDLQMFGQIRADPTDNGVRLTFTANEEPCHLVIRVYAASDYAEIEPMAAAAVARARR